MPIEDILAKFSNLAPRGRGYTADCPLHPDHPTVLRIYPEFGHLVLDCPRGCPDSQIAAAVCLNLGDLSHIDLPDNDEGVDDDLGDLGAEDIPETGEDPNDDEEGALPWFNGMYGEKIRLNYYDVDPVPVRQARAQTRTIPPKIFGNFWLESELCILFADTGKGKSILGVQIADSVTRGLPLAPHHIEIPAQRVLYFDYELSDTMFDSRYSRTCSRSGQFNDPYPFSMDFRRATPSLDPGHPAWFDTYDQYLHASFVEVLERSKARIVIVDNITFLNNNSNHGAGRALRLIAELQRLKKEHGLSILALAHTPKRRFSRGLNVNDLQGSKMLSNFADNIFAIGDSCLGSDIRYLKQIKPRNTELIYGASNVCTYRIAKRDNFLGFWFTGYSEEREHLENQLVSKEADRRILSGKVKELRADGLSIRKIADLLGISKSTANRILDENAF